MRNEPIIVDGILINPAAPFVEMHDCKKKVEQFKVLAKLYPDGGTLLISKAQVVKMKNGYQVSFSRPKNEIRFTDEEYDEICNWIMKKTWSRLFAGFWLEKGIPGVEPSFWCKNKKVAKEIAKLFNQKSILNWKALYEGNLEEIYVPNKLHNKNSPKLDKEAILKKIREDK